MDSAYAWKRFYRFERDRLGAGALNRLLDAASPLDHDPAGAVIVPHTRLEVTGHQIADAVATVIASGADRVLALGVLHGARRADRDQVAAARAGDAAAAAALRGVHDEHGLAAEEFSLDAFVELLALAAARVGRSIEVVRRYPFLVGTDPVSLPDVDELEGIVADGAFLVATTDPIHHGHAYGTPPLECRDPHDIATIDAARTAIDAQFAALSAGSYGEFAQLTERVRSDFRDTGPTVAHLVGTGFGSRIHDLALVDYAAALHAEAPSWVAAALVTVAP